VALPGFTHSGSNLPTRSPSNGAVASRRFDWPLAPSFSPSKSSDKVEIKDDRVAISFNRACPTSASIPSEISVRVALPNGKDFAKYHLDGNIPHRLAEQIRDALSFGELKILSPSETLQQLLTCTRSTSSVHWTPQRLDAEERSERLIEPMRRVLPTLEDYVRDPYGSCFRFFCAKPIDGLAWRMEAELKPEQGCSIIELSATDVNRRAVDKKFFQLKPEPNTPASIENLTLQCYDAMELFWNQGPQAIIEFLLKEQSGPKEATPADNNSPETPSLGDWQETDLFDLDRQLVEGSFDPSHCQFTHSFESGAELLLAMGHEVAILRLRSRKDNEAPFFEWRFQNTDGDFSSPIDPKRQEILRAFRTLKIESDGLRLNAVKTLNDLKTQYDAAGPKPERLLGTSLANHLSQLSDITVKPHIALAPNEVAGLFQGKEAIRLSLTDRSLRERKPHFFNFVVLGSLPDGSLTVEGANMLNGRCSALISPTALKRYGSGHDFILHLAYALALQPTRGFTPLQRVLEKASSFDQESSYYVADGEPYFSELPPTDDKAGQKMYEIASSLIRAYAAISQSSAASYKAAWVAPGSVEATLGMEHEPFLLTLTLQDSKVTKIRIIPQKDKRDGNFEPDTERALNYSCNLTIGGEKDAFIVGERQTLHHILELFNAVLSDSDLTASSGIAPIQTTQLHRFLERSFPRA